MKKITVKTTCSGNNVHTTLAPPASPLGDFRQASVQVRRINNIPDDVETWKVIKVFSETCDITHLGGKEPRLEFDFSELGTGRIIR